MSLDNKRMLSVLVYFTLAILTVLASAFFAYCLVVREVVMWARIIYFIWVALVIGVTIFDIVCTTTGEGKRISGLIVYVLSVLAVIMACVMYFANTGTQGLATEFFNLFLSVAIVSLMATGYMIATWCVGEKLVASESAQDEMRRKN